MSAAGHPNITIAEFDTGNIDPERFDHEAHVYVGWLYVREYAFAEALAKFDAGLKRLVKKLGAEDKYHATLTWFFLLLINERLEDNESWTAFKRRNPDLINNSRDILSRYYSEDYLFSDRARRRFVLPDKLAGANAEPAPL